MFENLPEPINLERDLDNRMLYWTDRGDPPYGNTVNRASMDTNIHKEKQNPEILANHLMEAIGLSLDIEGERMFLTDFSSSVYSANLNGDYKKTLLWAQCNLTGTAYVETASDIVY